MDKLILQLKTSTYIYEVWDIDFNLDMQNAIGE